MPQRALPKKAGMQRLCNRVESRLQPVHCGVLERVFQAMVQPKYCIRRSFKMPYEDLSSSDSCLRVTTGAACGVGTSLGMATPADASSLA